MVNNVLEIFNLAKNIFHIGLSIIKKMYILDVLYVYMLFQTKIYRGCYLLTYY